MPETLKPETPVSETPMVEIPEPERIAIGLVRRPKGIKGEAKVQLFSNDPKRFSKVSRVFLEREGQDDRQLSIQHWRQDTKGIRVKFAGIDTPEAVTAELTGGYLTVPRAELPALPAGEHYVFELLGCRVEDTEGNYLGQISGVESMPSVDVYIVRGGPSELLLPAVDDFIVSLDTAKGLLVATGIEELVE
jgi:16S rRNA processing protein RimM